MDHFAYAENAAREAEIRRVVYDTAPAPAGLSGYTAHLEGRVVALENCLQSLLDALEADGIITVVDP